MNIDGLSLHVLTAELQHRLEGGRIDKIFQPDKYTLLFMLRAQQENIRLLLSADPQQPRLHLMEDVLPNPEVPPAFCMLLRKHLENGRIGSLVQDGLDRTIALNIDVRSEYGALVTKSLVIELMGKYSNIILTDEHNIVIDSMKRVYHTMNRQREILPGRSYQKPPAQDKLNVLSVSTQLALTRLGHCTGDLLGAFLASFAGFGPLTAREIIFRAGLPTDFQVQQLDTADWDSLAAALSGLIGEIRGKDHTPCIVLDEHGKNLGIAAFSLDHLTNGRHLPFAALNSAMEYFSKLKPPQLPEKDVLQKLLQNELAKLSRKQKLLQHDIATANNAEAVKIRADNIMAHIYDIPHGSTLAVLDDIYSTSGEKLRVTLNPELSAIDNAQVYYTKYNKYKRAQTLLAEQLHLCIENAAYLDSIAVALITAASPGDLAAIRQELAEYGLIKLSKKKKLPVSPSRPLKVIMPDYTILVGRNNHQNDVLTFKLARAEDIWLHTKDIPGSHVILQGSADDDTALYAAAQLAAYFSKARSSSSVPVDYTQRRYVKKPAHSRPGFVIFTQQTTLSITPDEQFVKQLLAQST